MIVREYSRCPRCPYWRGAIPILGLLALIASTAIVFYEIGRYHRSPAEFVETVRDRLVIVEPEWRPADPGKAGRNR